MEVKVDLEELDQLRAQVKFANSLLTQVCLHFADDKGLVKVPGKVRAKANGVALQIKQMKTMTTIRVTKDTGGGEE